MNPPWLDWALRLPAFSADQLLPGNAGIYVDLDASGALGYNTQLIPVDWDMESVGTASWTAVDSTLSKVAGAPSGVGSQVLRVTEVSPTFWAIQLPGLTVGNRYLVSGWARGDGTVAPKMVENTTGTSLWLGTASALWQYFTFEYTCGNAGFLIGSADGVAGSVEFDALSFTNLSLATLTCKGDRGNLAQAIAAAMPWGSHASAPTSVKVNGRHVMYFDGSADRISAAGAANTFTWLSNGSAAMWSVFVKPTAAGSTRAVWSCFDGTAGSVGVFVRITPANALRVAIGKGAGLYALDVTSADGVVSASGAVISGGYAGSGNYVVRVNGMDVISQSLNAPSSDPPTGTLALGTLAAAGAINPYAGAMAGFIAVNRYDAGSFDQLHNFHRSYYGV